jgi:hypothetical protein
VLRPASEVRDFGEMSLLTGFLLKGSDYESEAQT